MKSSRLFAFYMVLLCPLSTSAQDSVRNASDVAASASIAVVLGLREGGELAIGMSAVPVQMSAAASSTLGAASTAAGQGSAQVAGSKALGPLPVADETITVISPAEALKKPAR